MQEPVGESEPVRVSNAKGAARGYQFACAVYAGQFPAARGWPEGA